MHDKTTHTSEQPNKEDIQYQVLTMTWDKTLIRVISGLFSLEN